MKNLVKNVIRSFKNNKISLIGLIFLLFFGLGTFCIMSNTTANITNQYTSIAKQGHLHDFTASELYEIGNAAYITTSKGFTYTAPEGTFGDGQEHLNVVSSNLYSKTGIPTSTTTQTFYYVVPSQVVYDDPETGKHYSVRTYNLKLDQTASTGLYSKFAESGSKTYTEFEVKITEEYTTTEPEYVSVLTKLNDLPVEKWKDNPDDILFDFMESNVLQTDYNKFLQGITNQTNIIYNMITGQDTLLSKYIDKEYGKEVEYKFFKSINVTATDDNIFYKVIQADPSDKIDNIVLFKDPNGNYGNQLFAPTDWAPYNSQLKFVDLEGKEVELGHKYDHFTVPTSFDELVLMEPVGTATMAGWSDEEKMVYSQIVQIRFKRMLSGDRSSENSYVEQYLNDIAAITVTDPKEYYQQFYDTATTLHSSYEDYLLSRSRWNENIIISMNGNIVFNWQVPTPMTCTLVNWTSHFSVINPQHLKAINKHILDSKYFNDFEPFREWYKVQYDRYPSGTISQSVAIRWFNSLTNEQYNFWSNPMSFEKKSQLTYNIIQKDGSVKPVIVVKGIKSSQWSGLPSESIASCGQYKQIIWGCGLSPDFMYPVVDITRPTPNVKTECLTYVNQAGYKSLKLAFINSAMEDFIVARFVRGVTADRQNAIINDLNKFCNENMLFPKDIKAVYRANDTSNILNSSGFRVSYIPNLVSVISLVATILCTFLGILAVVICLIIIKRYVENNRVNIGIMRANGVSKWKIAVSLFPFALLPAIVGGIGAYLVGLFLQIPMLNLFGNYWTLPTPILGFDWISFISCIFGPFLLFGLITLIATLWVLRTKSVELMKAGSEFKTNSFSRVVKKPFKHFGVLTRFRVSLAFNSLSRLIMLALMSCLTMTSLVFAMTSFGKLNRSQIINSSQFDYSFNLQLTTPTSSGGTYGVEDWSAKNEDGTYKGLGLTNPEQYIYNTSWESLSGDAAALTKWYSNTTIQAMDLPIVGWGGEYKKAIGNNGNLMLPTAADATGQKVDLQYLMNKTCSKLTLDYIIGLGSLSSNPWEIALALMPANSRNIASDSYNKIVNIVGQRIKDGDEKWKDFIKFFETKDEEGTIIKEPFELKADTKSWMTGFSPDYLKFLIAIYTDPDLMRDEYRISYGIIPENWSTTSEKKDEEYTYVTGTFDSISTRQRPTFVDSHEITIEGIKKGSEFIKLTDSKGNNLNTLLYDPIYNLDDYRPIIVNAFAAHQYNLKVGSTFTVKASNMVDRYDRAAHPEKYKDDTSDKTSFKVVGISQGTNGEAFYCRQNDANNAIGLPNGTSWNKTHKYMMWQTDTSDDYHVIDLSCIGAKDQQSYIVYTFDQTSGSIIKEETQIGRFNLRTPEGFNGLYTEDKSGKPLTSSISLYSYAGLYPGSSVFNSASTKKLFANENNLALANFISGINDQDTYNKCKKWLDGGYEDEDEYIRDAVEPFVNQIKALYGDTTMVTCICGANDVAASDLIYNNLISTFNLAETSIMSVVLPITIIVVGIISNLIINDSRKMAAMLKALGYSDRKNAMSILALFLPTIIFGLALAIPASIGITTGYQALIFTSANILVDVTRKWWYYLAAVGGIGVILIATYAVGLVSLKRDKLTEAIKR